VMLRHVTLPVTVDVEATKSDGFRKTILSIKPQTKASISLEPDDSAISIATALR
jgi:hypothetical protein